MDKKPEPLSDCRRRGSRAECRLEHPCFFKDIEAPQPQIFSLTRSHALARASSLSRARAKFERLQFSSQVILLLRKREVQVGNWRSKNCRHANLDCFQFFTLCCSFLRQGKPLMPQIASSL